MLPPPLAGIFVSSTLAQALAFHDPAGYAPVEVERDEALEARMFIVDAD